MTVYVTVWLPMPRTTGDPAGLVVTVNGVSELSATVAAGNVTLEVDLPVSVFCVTLSGHVMLGFC